MTSTPPLQRSSGHFVRPLLAALAVSAATLPVSVFAAWGITASGGFLSPGCSFDCVDLY